MPDIRLNSFITPPLSSGRTQANDQVSQKTATDESFSEILDKQLGQDTTGQAIKFSKHATQRLDSRNITLDSNDLERLSSAVDMASQKGVRNSLVVMDKLAFIVSVPEKTVVTAMPVDEARENVYTNIDGAVII